MWTTCPTPAATAARTTRRVPSTFTWRSRSGLPPRLQRPGQVHDGVDAVQERGSTSSLPASPRSVRCQRPRRRARCPAAADGPARAPRPRPLGRGQPAQQRRADVAAGAGDGDRQAGSRSRESSAMRGRYPHAGATATVLGGDPRRARHPLQQRRRGGPGVPAGPARPAVGRRGRGLDDPAAAARRGGGAPRGDLRRRRALPGLRRRRGDRRRAAAPRRRLRGRRQRPAVGPAGHHPAARGGRLGLYEARHPTAFDL